MHEIDFERLEPNLRTVALVGDFLQAWAILESSINSAIGKALGLISLQTVIVVRNVQFQAKIHILRTALNSTAVPADRRKEFDKILLQIQNYSSVRNMMAHDMFVPSSDGKGVEFLVAKARGELKFPEEVWSVAKFKAETEQLMNWDQQIAQLEAAITSVQETLKLFLAAPSALSLTTEPYNYLAQESKGHST